MSGLPVDVLGWKLDEARAELHAAGWTVEIVQTRTPRRVELGGDLRVVRQRHRDDGSVLLVVTHEQYTPAARPAGG